MDPKGKVALVTGGASGIGLAICKELLKEGVKGVSICDVDTAGGQKRAEELEEEFGKGRAIFLKMDVTKQKEFEEGFKNTINYFSTVDILVNNAGICNDKEWELEVDTNVNGVIRGILLAYQFMGTNKGGNGGTVINIASLAGVSPGLGIPIYSGLKSAVIGLTRAFGDPFHLKESNVRMMAMCPGLTSSNISPVKGNGRLLVKEWRTEVMKYFIDEFMQSAENVARGVLHMIREGAHGSIWASADEEPAEQLVMPEWDQLKIKQ